MCRARGAGVRELLRFRERSRDGLTRRRHEALLQEVVARRRREQRDRDEPLLARFGEPFFDERSADAGGLRRHRRGVGTEVGGVGAPPDGVRPGHAGDDDDRDECVQVPLGGRSGGRLGVDERDDPGDHHEDQGDREQDALEHPVVEVHPRAERCDEELEHDDDGQCAERLDAEQCVQGERGHHRVDGEPTQRAQYRHDGGDDHVALGPERELAERDRRHVQPDPGRGEQAVGERTECGAEEYAQQRLREAEVDEVDRNHADVDRAELDVRCHQPGPEEHPRTAGLHGFGDLGAVWAWIGSVAGDSCAGGEIVKRGGHVVLPPDGTRLPTARRFYVM